MEYREEEYIQLSGIQHFVFCRRQWALAYLEQQWVENERTADGRIMHRNVHDSSFREKRGDLLIVTRKNNLPVVRQTYINGEPVAAVQYRNDFVGKDGTRYD